MTRNFSPFSLNAPWNCVAIRLQKPSRQFFAGSCREGVWGLGIRAHQSSGLKVSEIERFYQRFLRAGDLVADCVPKTGRKGHVGASEADWPNLRVAMGLRSGKTGCFPVFAAR